MNYNQRRALEAKYMRPMTAIVRDHTEITNTDLATDRSGIDLIVKHHTWGLRVRTHQWLKDRDFTIRCEHPNPEPTEWARLRDDSIADYYLYAFENADQTGLAAWWIIDMHKLHPHSRTIQRTRYDNPNGKTAFYAIKLALLEQLGVITSSSEPQPPVQTALPVT